MATESPRPRSRILITGATGAIGGHIVESLRSRDADFAVMCRRSDQQEEFRARGVAAVHGDFSDPASVRTAVEGFDQMFLLATGLHQLEHDRGAIDAAVAAGVRHVLKVSTLDANPDSAIPWARDHARADAHLAAAGVRWTRLAPGAFTKNLLELAPAIARGFLPGTSSHGATSWVDVRDIADAATRVLLEPDRQGDESGRSYILTGTHPLSFPEIAAILSEQLGHRVRYLHLPAPAMYAALRLSGVPRWQARGLVHQFVDVVRHGEDNGRVHTFELEELLGRAPRGIADLVESERKTFSTNRR